MPQSNATNKKHHWNNWFKATYQEQVRFNYQPEQLCFTQG